jgi:hypothetical protein
MTLAVEDDDEPDCSHSQCDEQNDSENFHVVELPGRRRGQTGDLPGVKM